MPKLFQFRPNLIIALGCLMLLVLASVLTFDDQQDIKEVILYVGGAISTVLLTLLDSDKGRHTQP